MSNKLAVQLLVIWEFMKHLFEKVLTALPGIWKFMKVWLLKFIAWRKARYTRYRGLIWYRKLLNSILTFIVLFLLYLFIVDMNFLWLFGKSPGLSSIINPNQSTASIIYTSDGKILGKYFRENRTPVKYDEISPKLIRTLIATEDVRFYQHFGIDFEGVFAAV